MPLKKFDENLWTADQALSFVGLEVGARMTVVDVTGNGELLVHSPIRLTEEIKVEIDRLGNVRYIIAPNLYHHLFAGDFKNSYPAAELFVAPGLEQKRADLEVDHIIENDVEYAWSSAMAHHVVQGTPRFNEVVLYHREQKTLIVTDVGLHICEDSPLFTRMFFRTTGMFKKFGWSAPERWLLIRDKALFQNSMNTIVAWDFNKILLSHGRLIEKDGQSVFRRAFGA